jgi:hypothetical protein
VLRRKLQALFDAGRHAEVRTLLTAEGLSAADRRVLESFHPMLMGGNYLPDTKEGEVEIARISIRSSTGDVTCVYARPDRGGICYRLVDEYDGDTLVGPAHARTDRPMTLGEFAEFFLGAWPLLDVLEMNFDDDRAASLRFFCAASEFYPDFDRLCRQRVIGHFPNPVDDNDVEGSGRQARVRTAIVAIDERVVPGRPAPRERLAARGSRIVPKRFDPYQDAAYVCLTGRPGLRPSCKVSSKWPATPRRRRGASCNCVSSIGSPSPNGLVSRLFNDTGPGADTAAAARRRRSPRR